MQNLICDNFLMIELGTGTAALETDVQIDAITEKQFSPLEGLLDQGFKVPRGQHYWDDFPIWSPHFSSLVQATLLGAFKKNQLAATASVRVAELHGPNGSLEQTIRVGIVGAVATDLHFRGQGLASLLIESCVKKARSLDAQLIVLWSGEREFYQKLGFRSFGKQSRVILEDVLLPQIASAEEQKVYQGYVPELFNLVRARKTGLCLQASDRVWFEAHKNVEWFFTGSPEQPTAYAAVGRGVDLKGHIHEWGGSPRGLLQILTFLKTASPNLVLLGHPSLLGYYLGDGVLKQSSNEELCLGMCLDPRIEAQADQLWFWGLDAA